jgi:hypothetical protein
VRQDMVMGPVPWGTKPSMTVVAKASNNLTETKTRRDVIFSRQEKLRKIMRNVRLPSFPTITQTELI